MLEEVVQVPLVGLGCRAPTGCPPGRGRRRPCGSTWVWSRSTRSSRGRGRRAAAGRLEPRVSVGRVVHDEVDDHPDARRLGRADQFDEITVGPQTRVDAEKVGDVVAVVAAGGRVERHQPQASHAEVEEVLDALGHAADVAAAVAVPSRRRSRRPRSRRRRSSTTGRRCRCASCGHRPGERSATAGAVRARRTRR